MFCFCFLLPRSIPTFIKWIAIVVQLVVTSQIIDEVELVEEEDIVEDEAHSGSDDDDDDDDELLVPKSPVQDEFCSFDDTDGEDLETDGNMKQVFASVLNVDDEESQEDEEDDQPPALPPTLPPTLIVTDEVEVAQASPSALSPVSRPVSSTGVLLPSLVYAPRPYSAPKNISPFWKERKQGKKF